MPLGSLISAGANLAGGLIGKRSTDKANAANIKYQKQFAQQGIQWKVRDAEAAGVHPLYALGASTHSFAPSSVGDTSMSNAMANMGQDLSRAAHASSGHSQRQAAFSEAHNALVLERGQLENELLRQRIASAAAVVGQPGTPPAVPMPTDTMRIEGQGDVPLWTDDPGTAMVTPPSADVQAVKSFGYPLVRNPRTFSAGQAMQDEFGDSEIIQTLHGGGAYAQAMWRAIRDGAIQDRRDLARWLRQRYRGRRPALDPRSNW